jgi:hypothetical protein
MTQPPQQRRSQQRERNEPSAELERERRQAAIDLGGFVGVLTLLALGKTAIAITLLGAMAMQRLAVLAHGPGRRGR